MNQITIDYQVIRMTIEDNGIMLEQDCGQTDGSTITDRIFIEESVFIDIMKNYNTLKEISYQRA